MAFHRPIPESKLPHAKASGGMRSIVEAEKLMQIAFVLPSAVLIGLAGGAWADHAFHQKWIALAGICLGSISGFYFVIRLAMDAEKKSRTGGAAGAGEESKPD